MVGCRCLGVVGQVVLYRYHRAVGVRACEQHLEVRAVGEGLGIAVAFDYRAHCVGVVCDVHAPDGVALGVVEHAYRAVAVGHGVVGRAVVAAAHGRVVLVVERLEACRRAVGVGESRP